MRRPFCGVRVPMSVLEKRVFRAEGSLPLCRKTLLRTRRSFPRVRKTLLRTRAPGEVTTAELNTAIAGTSSNSNVVDLLEMTVGDPPSQPEVQTIADRLDQLIAALRR